MVEKFKTSALVPETIEADSEEEAREKLAKIVAEGAKLSQVTTEGKIVTKMYLYGSKESNYETGEELGLSENALENFVYALYEVEFDVEIDVKTGDSRIIAVDGRKLADET